MTVRIQGTGDIGGKRARGIRIRMGRTRRGGTRRRGGSAARRRRTRRRGYVYVDLL
jgi:hypothetical protein